MNSTERIPFLMKRYIYSTCTNQEFNELFELIKDDRNKDQVLLGLKEIWISTATVEYHSEEQWAALYSSMMNVAAAEQIPAKKTIKKISIGLRMAAAVVALIIMSTALFFYIYKPGQESIADHQSKSFAKFLPGGNKAVLTLSNGTRIILDEKANGQLATQTGIRISKSAEGQLIYKIDDVNPVQSDQVPAFNTIETPKGGQYQIQMPDGTRVWLNAMSSLRFPVAFMSHERKVTLKGEAYFEVAKNKKAPFKVVTDQQEVEVLGTHFNINSYSDEKGIKTTLLEGAVRILSYKGRMVNLLPGQQAQLQSDGIEVSTVDTEESVAWKNGYFMFHKADMESIMKQISRWYNVEVTFADERVKKRLFSGTVSRFEDASQLLDILELTKLVHFKIEGRRIIVTQ